MAELRIRFDDDELLKKMDAIAAEEGYSTRTKFVESLISRYILYKDRMFLNELPDVVKAICKEAVLEEKNNSDILLRSYMNSLLKLQESIDSLRAVFLNELNEKADE